MITQNSLTLHDSADGHFQIEACFQAEPESPGIGAIRLHTRNGLQEEYRYPNCTRFVCPPLPPIPRDALPVFFEVEECPRGNEPGLQTVFGPHFSEARDPNARLNPCRNWDLTGTFISPEQQACLDTRGELLELRSEMLRLCAEIRQLRDRRNDAASRADLAAKFAIALGVAIFAAQQLPWPASIIVQVVLALALAIAIGVAIANNRERNRLNEQIALRNAALADLGLRYGELMARMREACCDRYEIPEVPGCP